LGIADFCAIADCFGSEFLLDAICDGRLTLDVFWADAQPNEIGKASSIAATQRQNRRAFIVISLKLGEENWLRLDALLLHPIADGVDSFGRFFLKHRAARR
jgi:hypothetical protein